MESEMTFEIPRKRLRGMGVPEDMTADDVVAFFGSPDDDLMHQQGEMSMEEGLLPCPHCGGKADFNNDGERWDQVICGSCGCRGSEYPNSREKAAAAWNRRSTPD